jgi:hypothetical protein
MPDLASRVAAIEQKIRGIPSRFAGGATIPQWYIEVEGGNVLAVFGAVTVYGLKYGGLTGQWISEVPADDPEDVAAGAAPDYLSPARLLKNDGTLEWVWVASRIDPAVYELEKDMIGGLPQGTPFISLHSFSLPVTGSDPVEYRTVYIPSRI